ncbi:MAG: zinc-ribbon and DUF3426 domain-containing protein [Gammaproteobacteria bacterium]
MYCRCPHCDTQQKVSTQQLRDRRGLLNCKFCGQPFDALPSLSDTKKDPETKTPQFELVFERRDKRQAAWAWWTGNIIMSIILLTQIGYFDGRRLYEMPRIHSVLTRVCGSLHCRLPAVKNPREWAVSHAELQAHLDSRYVLTAALTNQAEITQSFPRLKLRLSDFNGQVFAERVFNPQQYTQAKRLAANETVEVYLPFVMSSGEIGGFSLTTL